MKRINLLPQEERVKASRERGLIWAILILVAVVVILGLVYMKYNGDVNSKQEDLSAVQLQTETVQTQVQALSPYAALQAQRTAMMETAKNLYLSSVPFSTLLQQLSLVIPENVRLTHLTAVVPKTMLPAGEATEPQGSAETADVTFTGDTENHRDVAEFMTRLGLMPQLRNITLSNSLTTNTSVSAGSTTSTDAYIITAQLRPYTTPPPTSKLAEGAP